MIKVNKIDPPTILVYDPDNNQYILNEYEWLDLRCQIAKNKATGWVCFNDDGDDFLIDENGNVDPYPKQMDLYENLLYAMIDWKDSVKS